MTHFVPHSILQLWEDGDITTHEALRLLAEDRKDLAEEYKDIITAYGIYEHLDQELYEQAKAIVMNEGRSVDIGHVTMAYIDPDPKEKANIQTVYDVISMLDRRGMRDIADMLRNGIQQERRKPHFRWTEKKEKHS